MCPCQYCLCRYYLCQQQHQQPQATTGVHLLLRAVKGAMQASNCIKLQQGSVRMRCSSRCIEQQGLGAHAMAAAAAAEAVLLVPVSPADVHEATVPCGVSGVQGSPYQQQHDRQHPPGGLCLGNMDVIIEGGPARHPSDTACVGQVGMQPAQHSASVGSNTIVLCFSIAARFTSTF